MIKKVLTWLLPATLVLGLGGVALATDAGPVDAGVAVDAGVEAPVEAPATTPDPVEDVSGFIQELAKKFMEKEYMPAFALLVIGLVQLFKRYGVKVVRRINEDWAAKLETRLGKTLTSFGIAAALTLLTAITAGQTVTVALVSTAVTAGWAAAGGWEHIKDLLGLPGTDEAAA